MIDIQVMNSAIFALIVIYLSSILFFSAYLRRHHAEVWRSLGAFSLSNWGIGNSCRTANYVLFRRAHKELKDRKASIYLMGIRLLTFGVLTPLIVLYWVQTHRVG